MKPDGRLDALHALRFGRVMPLSAERKPLLAYAEAFADEVAVHRFYDANYATGVGVLTDHRYVVLDVESVAKKGEDGFATLDRLEHLFGRVDSRSHRTKSGGLHLICRQPPGLAIRSAQGEVRGAGFRAPGLDIVAGNAVMRWIGTPGYELQADSEIAMLPDGWCSALVDPPQQHAEERPIEPGEKRDRKYAVAALRNEGVELARISAQRNVALAKSAFKLGRLSPPLRYDEIEAVLLAACEVNGSLREHGMRSCRGTILRCATAGQQRPLRLVG